MSTQPFDFRGAEGQLLSGRLDRPDGSPRAFALFAHCFTCTKASVAAVRIARALVARGIGVLRFDFTGLGESGGDFADSTFSGSVRDLVAAAEAMAEAGCAPDLLVGHSLGGAAILAAAAEIPSAAAVSIIAAPYEVEHVTRLFGERLPMLLEKGEAEIDIGGRPFKVRRSFVEDLRTHDLEPAIAGLQRPLLILHAPQDPIVGIDNATKIFLAARHPKSFISLDTADHLLTRSADARYAAETIAAWASRYLPARQTGSVEAVRDEVVVQDTGAGRFQVEVTAGGARFMADEPVEVGGLGTGPTPYDLLSAGLGACTAMTMRLYAEQKAWPLAGIRVTVCHRKAKDRTPADVFVRRIDLEGELDEAQRTRLLEIAARCPVHRTLEGGATVEMAAAAQSPVNPEERGLHMRDMETACASGE